jgi:hypothetical protein
LDPSDSGTEGCRVVVTSSSQLNVTIDGNDGAHETRIDGVMPVTTIIRLPRSREKCVGTGRIRTPTSTGDKIPCSFSYAKRCIATVVASELFDPVHALGALRLADQHLRGLLGMKTLDAADLQYRPYHDNSNDLDDPATAKGRDYHQVRVNSFHHSVSSICFTTRCPQFVSPLGVLNFETPRRDQNGDGRSDSS